jgi:hypothetical protein
MDNSYSSGKWSKQIVELQHEDGSWGCFHTLSQPTKQNPMTTEQALRRLRILGFTKDDEPVARALVYMEDCLSRPYPTVFHEKKHDSKTYGDLMLATWIRLFDPTNKVAYVVAKKWANTISQAFKNDKYSHEDYVAAYESDIGIKLNPKAGCLADFVTFYQIALLPGLLSPHTELLMLDYVLCHPDGINYIYHEPLNAPPVFTSRKASHYTAALELLALYNSAPDKMGFAVQWLINNRGSDGLWDMGANTKDGIYFPLSDSWRKEEDRKHDCTYRIEKLLAKLGIGLPARLII